MRLLANCITFVLLFSTSGWADKTVNPVSYDKKKDTLSLNAENISLKQILTRIAMQSHLEVLFDELADQNVTLRFEDQPLENGLENLLKSSSHTFRYVRNDEGRDMLIGVSVLPKGEGTDNNASPLLNIHGEAFMHAKNNRALSIDEDAKRSLSNQRWEARLSDMPKQLRERALQHAKERLDRKDKKAVERIAKKEVRKAKKKQRKEKREAERQKMLDELSPEDRAFMEQRRENAKEMARLNAQQ